MSDKCPFCGAEKGKYSLKNQWMCSSFWIPSTMTYMQSSECKDHQISDLKASRDRWRELAAAQKVIIAYEHRDADYGINAMIQAYGDRDKAISALKAAGEWEE